MGEVERGQIVTKDVVKRKLAIKALKEAGVPIPDELKERIIHRVKSPIGTLTVREGAGVVRSPALSILKQFEKNIEGQTPVADAMAISEAAGERLSGPEKALIHALTQTRRGKSVQLARHIAEQGVNPVRVFDLYSKGVLYMKKAEALQAAAEQMPQVMKNLLGHAASEAGDVCSLCVGTGEVARSATCETAPAKQVPCPSCEGAGKRLEPSKLKQFAIDKLLEVTDLSKKGGGVTVNQQTNVVNAPASGAGILEKMRKAADEVLYQKKEDVVEAEVVNGGA